MRPEMRLEDLARAWPIAVPVLLAAALYARGFAGFWLGDDLPNLHRTHEWAQAGVLWIDTARQFVAPITGGGSFIRPMVIASFSLNYEISGANYAGWYAINFMVHLANVALVSFLVLALAHRLGREGRGAALAAGLVFGLSPAIAEGVYWVSARADGWVTLLSLGALATWLHEDARGTRHAAWVYPLLLAIALGFKESAAVLPLQMALVALAWPGAQPRRLALSVLAGFAVMILYFAFRAYLFGTLFQTYFGGTGSEASLWLRVIESIRSLPAWWSGVAGPRPGQAAIYLVLLATGAILGLAPCRGSRLRLALAFLCAGAGLLLATLVNLGGFAPSGEGGRLLYGPACWVAIGLGLALAQPKAEPVRAVGRWSSLATTFLAAVLGAVLLQGVIRHVAAVQDRSRALVTAIADWAVTRAELTMVIVPEQEGLVVSFRNGQGGIVLPPLQPRPLLHLVLPSLPRDIPGRYDGLAVGLATRLGKVVPERADAATLQALAKADAALWPPVACWSPRERRIITLPRADPSSRDGWIRETRAAARVCLPEEPSFRSP